ncbi:extracellular solute-binding protein [Patescibacteria group bacterium]
MQKTSNFQLILRIVFGGFIVVAVLIFAGVLPGFQKASEGTGGEVTMWGSVPEEIMRSPVSNLNSTYSGEFTLVYEEKNTNTFESDLVGALAAGVGPDIFLLPHDLILSHQDKISSISLEVVSERDFKNAFSEEGELYFTENGALALPLYVNPIVMYWNRDLFSSANIANPPEFWDELVLIAPQLTDVGQSKYINQSAVSFGEFSNVLHAKDIISMLILQTGNSITEFNNQGVIEPVLTNTVEGYASQPVESVLRFYTEFSNPSKPVYSWNRSISDSKNAFIAEELAMYFGYASELRDIATKNPHLNFDVAVVPQIRDVKKRLTYGRVSAVAITKSSDNPLTALHVALILSGREFADEFSRAIAVPPARRDLLSQKQVDAYNAIFYESALLSHGWLDPNPKETYTIFKDMVEGVTSGKFRISEAVMSADAQMERIK